MSERLKRKGSFQIDTAFEGLMGEVNQQLASLEKTQVEAFEADRLPPLVFFCYPPRTGSTMMTQYLARTGDFSYISNYTARYWDAPFIALLTEQKLGLREQYHDQVADSRYGATSALTDPHEFGFFWNKLLTSEAHHRIDASRISEDQKQFFIRQVNAMRAVYGKPFFFKNGIAGLNPDIWADWFPDALFVQIDRDPVWMAQSILIARKELYQDTREWWSLRPENTADIQARASGPEEEVAEQVQTLRDQMAKRLAPFTNRVQYWNYETFCAAPHKTLERFYHWLDMVPAEDSFVRIPTLIEVRQKIKLNVITFNRLKDAVTRTAKT